MSEKKPWQHFDVGDEDGLDELAAVVELVVGVGVAVTLPLLLPPTPPTTSVAVVVAAAAAVIVVVVVVVGLVGLTFVMFMFVLK